MHVEFAESSLSAGPAPESGVGLGPCSRFAVSAFIPAMYAVLDFCIRSLDAGIETLDSQNAVMDQAA